MSFKIIHAGFLIWNLALFGCASEEKINLIHVHEASNFADQKSVFYSNDTLNDLAVTDLLKTRIKLPNQIKIAVIKLQPMADENEYLDYRSTQDIVNQTRHEPARFLLEMLNSESFRNHVITSVLVPESLVPAKADIKWIRNLGATMQADLVLVVDSRNDRYRDRQIIKNGIAMSVSSADTYLIDTRTGVILNTNSYTKDAFTEKTARDFDAYETLERARVASEKKIYKELTADLKQAVEAVR